MRRLLLGLALCVAVVCVSAFAEHTSGQANAKNSDAAVNVATTWIGTCTECKRKRIRSTEKRPTDTTCLKTSNGKRCPGTVIWQEK
jgi:cytochrome c553